MSETNLCSDVVDNLAIDVGSDDANISIEAKINDSNDSEKSFESCDNKDDDSEKSFASCSPDIENKCISDCISFHDENNEVHNESKEDQDKNKEVDDDNITVHDENKDIPDTNAIQDKTEETDDEDDIRPGSCREVASSDEEASSWDDKNDEWVYDEELISHSKDGTTVPKAQISEENLKSCEEDLREIVDNHINKNDQICEEVEELEKSNTQNKESIYETKDKTSNKRKKEQCVDPSIIPTSGKFYMHDLRTEDEIENVDEKKATKTTKKYEGRWQHDLYDSHERNPQSTQQGNNYNTYPNKGNKRRGRKTNNANQRLYYNDYYYDNYYYYSDDPYYYNYDYYNGADHYTNQWQNEGAVYNHYPSTHELRHDRNPRYKDQVNAHNYAPMNDRNDGYNQQMHYKNYRYNDPGDDRNSNRSEPKNEKNNRQNESKNDKINVRNEPMNERRNEPMVDRRKEPMANRRNEPMNDRRNDSMNDHRKELFDGHRNESMNDHRNEYRNDPMNNRRNELMNDRRNEPMNDRRNEPMNNRRNDPMNNRRNDPMNDRKNEPMINRRNEPMNDRKNEPMINRRNEPTNDRRNEPMNDRRNEPINDRRNEPMNNRINDSMNDRRHVPMNERNNSRSEPNTEERGNSNEPMTDKKVRQNEPVNGRNIRQNEPTNKRNVHHNEDVHTRNNVRCDQSIVDESHRYNQTMYDMLDRKNPPPNERNPRYNRPMKDKGGPYNESAYVLDRNINNSDRPSYENRRDGSSYYWEAKSERNVPNERQNRSGPKDEEGKANEYRPPTQSKYSGIKEYTSIKVIVDSGNIGTRQIKNIDPTIATSDSSNIQNNKGGKFRRDQCQWDVSHDLADVIEEMPPLTEKEMNQIKQKPNKMHNPPPRFSRVGGDKAGVNRTQPSVPKRYSEMRPSDASQMVAANMDYYGSMQPMIMNLSPGMHPMQHSPQQVHPIQQSQQPLSSSYATMSPQMMPLSPSVPVYLQPFYMPATQSRLNQYSAPFHPKCPTGPPQALNQPLAPLASAPTTTNTAAPHNSRPVLGRT